MSNFPLIPAILSEPCRAISLVVISPAENGVSTLVNTDGIPTLATDLSTGPKPLGTQRFGLMTL